MRSILLTLVLALGLANKTLTTAPHGPVEPLGDPLAELERWGQRGPQYDPGRIVEAEQALRELDIAWTLHADRRMPIQTAWLDFLGRCRRIADDVSEGTPALPLGGQIGVHGEADLRRRVSAILRRRLPELRTWLTREVLFLADRHPVERRAAGCEVLRDDESQEAVMALLSCTRSAPTEVLDAAIGSLVGRQRSEVHSRLIDLLGQSEHGEVRIWRGAIERHFRSLVLLKEDRRTIARVSAYVAPAIVAEDWRSASRAVSVGRCLPHSSAFPILIRGLEVWKERGADEEAQVRRVQGEILAEFHRRSGRLLGLHPERWTALWEGYQRGEVSLKREAGEGERITQAGFFGLRPETDRVVFVLDRSGSMESSFGDDPRHTSLDEAVDQMSQLLTQLGPRTRFGVVVFADSSAEWHKELRNASKANIKAARSWVLHGGPGGGTQLRSGVLEALHADGRKGSELESLEADTIIILCDGATAEGPGWVAPLLREVHDRARVVFHAVQLGASGDGTLQTLCEETNGEFVVVEG